MTNLPEAYITLTIDGDEYDIHARATSISNSGIGPYEFWGAKCYDKGRDYVEDYEIDEIVPLYDDTVPFGLTDRIYNDPELSEAVRLALDETMSEWGRGLRDEEMARFEDRRDDASLETIDPVED